MHINIDDTIIFVLSFGIIICETYLLFGNYWVWRPYYLCRYAVLWKKFENKKWEELKNQIIFK